LGLVAVISLAPLVLEPRPIHFIRPLPGSHTNLTGKVIVVLVMVSAIVAGAGLSSRQQRFTWAIVILFASTAALLTACHWYIVDTRHTVTAGRVDYFQAEWQSQLYLGILNRERKDLGGQAYTFPHLYRPLPYGFTRSLEVVTADWWFSCLMYRWFFTYWFIWGYFCFARLFISPVRALISVACYPVLYPLSIQYYGGQLTDPMSHALFVLALIYLVEDRFALLAVSLGLGVLAKETVLIIVPAYLTCYARRGVTALVRTAILAVIVAGSFLLSRIPLGWMPGSRGTPWNLIWNLGIGELPPFPASIIHQNIIQPALFVGVFLPLIALRWRSSDWLLKALFLTLTPLILATSLLYGWLYESRNYVPLLPVLTTLAMTPKRMSG
jgi:hypothetical protein